jgi:hypothetical protein
MFSMEFVIRQLSCGLSPSLNWSSLSINIYLFSIPFIVGSYQLNITLALIYRFVNMRTQMH